MYSIAFGVGTKDSDGNWLEVFYPQPVLSPDSSLTEALSSALTLSGENQVIELNTELLSTLITTLNSSQTNILTELKKSSRPAIVTILVNDSKPESVPEVYLKLHLLSHRLVKPHGTNLDGMFGILPNVAWTNKGAIAIDELAARQLQARVKGELLEVSAVDKFPKMTNYVVPTGVRIAHTARVRLGAYIGEGTTIMHEGFVNFNAGSEGPAMIEGRITAGVFVGSNSDLGGGCSILGTLSGGGKEVISIGENCLVGANAGLGIPLGDRCTIEAGLYLTAGTKVTVLDSDNNAVEIIKALKMANKNDLLFRRNSTSGTVECLTNKSSIELNEELHAHN